MRVAICLSGFPRTMEYTFPYLKKYILDKLNPDIFFYGYSDDEHNISARDIVSYYNPKQYIIRPYTTEIEEEIWSSYKTKAINNPNLPRAKPIQILSQYYNVLHCNNLKQQYEYNNNFVYDIVIRARTDYYFYREFTNQELELEPATVYIPNIWDFGGVSSGFAYGTSSAMDIYSSLFNKIRKYNLEHNKAFHPERLKAYHISQSGLKRTIVKNHYWWELADFATNQCTDKYIDGLTQNPSRRLYK